MSPTEPAGYRWRRVEADGETGPWHLCEEWSEPIRWASGSYTECEPRPRGHRRDAVSGVMLREGEHQCMPPSAWWFGSKRKAESPCSEGMVWRCDCGMAWRCTVAGSLWLNWLRHPKDDTFEHWGWFRRLTQRHRAPSDIGDDK